MALLLARVLLAPTLLAGCSFAGWRWGRGVGGWLLGLPLISGPVSLLLFLEHGTRFAESAARGTLLGILATCAFCALYATLARRARWWLTLAIAYAACISVAWGVSFIDLPVAAVAAVVAIVLTVLSFVPGPEAPAEPVARPAGLALLPKMVAASLIVLGLTAVAGVLGPRLAGLLAPLPVLLAFVAAGAHRRAGYGAARGLLRGAIAGSWGGAAFFATLALELRDAGPAMTYAVALLAALLVSGLAMWLQRPGTTAALRSAWRSLRSALLKERHLPRARAGRMRVPRPAFVWMLRG